MKQLEEEHGFFIWLNEKLSTHPHLPKRLYELSRFFELETTPELKEPKGKVVIGILVAFVSSIVLTVGLTAAIAALGNSGFFDELTAEMGYEIEGVTPLMEAAGENDAETIGVLIEEGADINAADETNSTALHWAVYYGNLEAAKVLLEAGANSDTVDVYDQTPLISAVYNGDVDMAELLLEYGADPAYEDPYGYTAYDYAVENGDDEITAILENE